MTFYEKCNELITRLNLQQNIKRQEALKKSGDREDSLLDVEISLFRREYKDYPENIKGKDQAMISFYQSSICSMMNRIEVKINLQEWD